MTQGKKKTLKEDDKKVSEESQIKDKLTLQPTQTMDIERSNENERDIE